jgi:hypothetical protein
MLLLVESNLNVISIRLRLINSFSHWSRCEACHILTICQILEDAVTEFSIEMMQVLASLNGSASVAAVNELVAVCGMCNLTGETNGAL